MTMFSGPDYDNWLERPFQERWRRDVPDWVEDLLGKELFIEEDDEWGTVETYEAWEDEDENGPYGGVDLVLKLPRGGWKNLTQEEAEALPRRNPK